MKDKFKIGQKVRYTNYFIHSIFPECYPPVGTEGIITELFSATKIAIVQWASGSTSNDDKWASDINDLSLIKE